MRHCALCLVQIPTEEVKCCSKCHRRAYCSRECQVKDWKPKGYGQGHKSWCGIEYGEEDLDWEVVPVDGKGEGLVAKRFFPKASRIMVDGFRSRAKVFQNIMDSCASLGRSNTGNHSCDANAYKFPVEDDRLKALVVYTQKDIQPGEEICFNYICFNETLHCAASITGMKSLEDCRGLLKSKWDIVCPPDCRCRDEELNKIIQESHLADASILRIGQPANEENADVDLEIVRQLLANHERVRSSLVDKARLLVKQFEIGIQREKTMQLGKDAIEEACQILESFLHPEFSWFLTHKNWMEDPSTHPGYLKLERFKSPGETPTKTSTFECKVETNVTVGGA